MSLIYYSVAAVGNPRYERQWLQSIRSLRAYNKSIPVHLVWYGTLPDPIAREAERQRVIVHRAGDYRTRLEEQVPQQARALSRYPVLHKVLSLRCLAAESPSQVLYLDCDTFFFGDVVQVLRKYDRHHFCAREEPWSKRSHYGYRPAYLDESALADACKAEGLAFIPPYNTGMFILNRNAWSSLAAASATFLGYAWRLLLGISDNERLARECSPELLREVRLSRRRSDGPPLRYPSSNWWIVEEIAMLFTLGGIGGLSHGVLLRKDAVQNGESAASASPTMAHYFTHLEDEFFRRVKRF